MSKLLRDCLVVGQRDSGPINLKIASLVDELSYSGQRRMSESDVWGNQSQHLRNWSVDLQEDSVVELLQTEQLKDLPWLGGHLVDTDESGNEEELSFGLNEEVSTGSGLSSETNKVSFARMVLLQVLD